MLEIDGADTDVLDVLVVFVVIVLAEVLVAVLVAEDVDVFLRCAERKHASTIRWPVRFRRAPTPQVRLMER